MQGHSQDGAGSVPTADAHGQRGLSGMANAVASRFHGIAGPRPEWRTLLIRDATVLVDADAGTVFDADIHVRDGVVAEVGPALHVEGGDVIDGSGFIVMPGLVDTHGHMWTSLMRNNAANAPAALTFHSRPRSATPIRRRTCTSATLCPPRSRLRPGSRLSMTGATISGPANMRLPPCGRFPNLRERHLSHRVSVLHGPGE